MSDNNEVDIRFRVFIDHDGDRWVYYSERNLTTQEWDAWRWYCSLAAWATSPEAKNGIVLDLGE